MYSYQGACRVSRVGDEFVIRERREGKGWKGRGMEEGNMRVSTQKRSSHFLHGRRV